VSELLAACHGADPARDGWPTVSVVVPVRNEGRHLTHAVASILTQEYPIEFDVCLAVAPSNDDTVEIADALVAADPRVSVVANPAGVTPAGLNAAIGATTGSIVVRVDGHSELSPGYIRRAVETMCRTGAVNVGGRQVPKPETPFEEAVAAATTSWMGTGGATYRVGGIEGPVDTVYLGVFDRAAGDVVGWFDEALIRNQDYELNIRLRKAGGRVWFDPELWVGYRPRGTWTALAKQYYEYGFWKAEVLRKHPDSLRPRQVAPALVTAAVIGGTAIAGTGRFRWFGVPTAYVAVCAVLARRTSSSWVRALALTRILGAMHLCWGIGLFTTAAHRALARIRASVR
jgi:succinoglycan biosynthesis protein ExoA